MSVRDPFSRVKSAYNWRKYKCRTDRSVRDHDCKDEELFMFEFCYTTLNAFCEGACDGPRCGDGWDDTSIYAQRLRWEDCTGDCRGNLREGPPVRSCEDVRRAIIDRPIGTGTHAGRRLAAQLVDVRPYARV